ncbi:thiamine phosphate synthase [Cognatiluteimonas profundi]|uniref:thiamine phosphate synthase n=1 Tax=Cognatiluteimonas profundi TaxID=2594501 RepID=UPI001E4A1991|nr:thiamine phosphate synthase [Lysobacter profundi]
MTRHDMRRESPQAGLLRGLYLITPDEPDDGRLLARVAPVLAHAACLQYRNKRASPRQRLRQVDALRTLCTEARVPLIVNDDAALAASTGADGVHLGEHDGAVAAARALLGNDAIVGVSCYDDIRLGLDAAAQGADYLAFGAFFVSPTKPTARRASIDLLQRARITGLPLVAIGGISPDNARSVIAAGADMIAAISGVFDAPDPVAAARAYAACFA